MQRSRILDAAAQVFGRSDVVSVSMGDIAAAAGISRTLLYHYFPGKPEIVDALQQNALHDLEEMIRAIQARGGDTRSQITLLVNTYYDILNTRPSVVNTLIAGQVLPVPPSAAKLRNLRRLRGILIDWLESLRPAVRTDIPPERLLLVAVGALFTWYLPTPIGTVLGARPGTKGKNLEAHKEAVIAVLLGGFLGTNNIDR